MLIKVAKTNYINKNIGLGCSLRKSSFSSFRTDILLAIKLVKLLLFTILHRLNVKNKRPDEIYTAVKSLVPISMKRLKHEIKGINSGTYGREPADCGTFWLGIFSTEN